MSQGTVCPGTRPGFGDSQSDSGYHPGACHGTRGFVCAIKLLLGPVPPQPRPILSPSCLPLLLFTHTVHRPVMENADKLTGRRIQAVMREGSQGGSDVGGMTRGRWGRWGRPSYLKILRQNHQLPRPGGERGVKVQGPVSGQSRRGWVGKEGGHPARTRSAHARTWSPSGTHRGRPHPTQSHRLAQGLRRRHNIWTGSHPLPEGAGLGAMAAVGTAKGPSQRKPGVGPAPVEGRPHAGNHATTAPRERAGPSGKPSPAPARVDAWSPQPASPRARGTSLLR